MVHPGFHSLFFCNGSQQGFSITKIVLINNAGHNIFFLNALNPIRFASHLFHFYLFAKLKINYF